MSATAVYNVTRALRLLLRSQLTQISANAIVTLLPPGDALPEASGVNLYLYRVTESPFTRNQPWPGDRVTPPSDRPALGLQLYYLLTPLGTRPSDTSDEGDDAHTMLGAAMRTLQQNPVLNDVHLPGFDADTILPDFLQNSFEQIKVILAPTTLDELSKIWATINKPYRLSVAYEVSLVQIRPTSPPSFGGGIVLETDVDVITLDAPRLTALRPVVVALTRIDSGGALVGNTLAIDGFGLAQPGLAPGVRVAGRPVTVLPVPAPTGTSVTITLPSDVDAGPTVDVRATLGSRTGAALPLTISPWLARLTPIRTALDPALAADQTLVLEGNGFTPLPQAVRLSGPGNPPDITVFSPGGTDTRAQIAIPVGLANGNYDVRIILGDAARSASNPRTLEVMPLMSGLAAAIVTAGGRQVHRLTVAGARLAGADVRLLIDGIAYIAPANGTAAQLVYTLGRQLATGSYSIAVSIDGHLSRTVPLVI